MNNFSELEKPLKRFSKECEYHRLPAPVINLMTFFSVRERLKDVLRQYELRERHFECVIRSKELEVLLSRARAAEQKQLAQGEKTRAEKAEEEVGLICISYLQPTLNLVSQNQQLRKELEDAQNGQTMLIDKLIACCKEVKFIMSLR